MLEEGIDIGHKKPQPLGKELQEKADVVVIVCGGDFCPVVHARQVEKWNIPDATRMSLADARKVRDEIKAKVPELVRRITRLSLG